MTVINPSSISGITSITMPSGDGNVLTIHTNDGTERFRIDSSGNVKVGSACTISQDGDVFFTGVCTATTLTGAASGLTGALPAIDGSALTGIAATDNVRTGILDVAGVSTFRNTMNVGAAVTISESGIEASGIGITCANINGTQIGGRRNIIINGAMRVAQRGTSSTSSGYATVDRIKVGLGGNDEGPTMSQANVSSGTPAYTSGFRNSFKIVNGNQTSGAGAGDTIEFHTRIEGQDITNSGWNYNSTSSFVTLSFWIKSSVAQSFPAYLHTQSNPEYIFPFETGSLTASTWTKITKTIPGNSNLVFDNDTAHGLKVAIIPFRGTDYTSSSVTYDAWQAYSSSARTRDMTSTWYTTNDSTLEVTGLQLEVGSQATPFEHRSVGEELQLCKRYYQQYVNISAVGNVPDNGSRSYSHALMFPVEMRAAPTITISNTGSSNGQVVTDAENNTYISSLLSTGVQSTGCTLSFNLSGDLTNYRGAYLINTASTANQTTYLITSEL